LLDALVRLVNLLGRPALVPGLAPLIQQEVILRLLTGPHGPQLRRLVTAGSPSQQIAKAVAWLKQNFVQALHGDELANRAHMSPSTFRQHFRALTGVSPLQYQKQLRLQMHYSVLQRTPELAVRLALGAQRGQVMAMIVREGMRPATVGMIAGLAGSLVLTRLVSNALFGVTPYDPVTLALVCVALAVLALAGSCAPAARAASVDPLRALRDG
jgi:AraC-like DNA-binding protein